MSHVPIETAEEDAADLQFPKENQVRNSCNVCHSMLNAPFIVCAECKCTLNRYQICLKCFASGAETENHKNIHKYIIVHDSIKVFSNTAWGARDDYLLLDLLGRFGFTNWSDISRTIGKYSAEECRNHYLNNYFKEIFYKACNLMNFPYNRNETPYLFRSGSIDPPRNKFDGMQNKYIADYRYARSEFDTPFDGSAEKIICNLHSKNEWSDEFGDISDLLNTAVGQAYNNRLRERQRRHSFVRQHGLIMPNRTKSWMTKYKKAIDLKNSKENRIQAGRFAAMMQLSTGVDFDRILEGLQYELDLRKFILKLYELRSNGIMTYQGGRTFQIVMGYRKLSTVSHSSWNWKYLTENIDAPIEIELESQILKRKKSAPLNIIGLPNYDKLTRDEQELCSVIRVIPDAYLIYKKLLITENTKIGYVRLADARRLIKIDVNKTRVMYDFFFEHGFINKSPKTKY